MAPFDTEKPLAIPKAKRAKADPTTIRRCLTKIMGLVRENKQGGIAKKISKKPLSSSLSHIYVPRRRPQEPQCGRSLRRGEDSSASIVQDVLQMTPSMQPMKFILRRKKRQKTIEEKSARQMMYMKRVALSNLWLFEFQLSLSFKSYNSSLWTSPGSTWPRRLQEPSGVSPKFRALAEGRKRPPMKKSPQSQRIRNDTMHCNMRNGRQSSIVAESLDDVLMSLW